jgi:putative effector of murein hydrolase
VGEKMKWRKIIMAVLIGSFMLVEYGTFVVYVSRFLSFVNYEEYRRIHIILDIFLTHAVVCLGVAIVTGFIIHKKTTVDTLEIFLCSCFCAVVSLPASLLLMFMTGALSTIAPDKWIDTPLYGVVESIMLIVAYVLGIILPSAQSIRMAKIVQNGSDKETLQRFW